MIKVTVNDKLHSIQHLISMCNWASIACLVLFFACIVTVIVLYARDEHKAFFNYATFGFVILLIITLACGFHERNEYQGYKAQMNFVLEHGHIMPQVSRKMKLAKFEKLIKLIHMNDVNAAQKMQQIQKQQQG